MDEQVDMEIDGEKDSEGNLIPDTICIRFKHPEINSRLAKFEKAKKLQANLIASKDAFPSEEAFQHEVEPVSYTHLDVYKRQIQFFNFIHMIF